MARLLGTEIVRTAAQADVQVDRLVDVGDAGHERVLRRLLLAQLLDVLAQAVDVAPPIGAQLPLESPAAERQQARLEPIEHLRRVEALLQIAREDVGPEILALDRHRLELEAAARTEVV